MKIMPSMTQRRARQSLTREQLLLGLVQIGAITRAEAVAAARTGAMPAAIEAVVAAMGEPQQTEARITWASMSTLGRNHPLTAIIASAKGLAPKQLDKFFEAFAGGQNKDTGRHG